MAPEPAQILFRDFQPRVGESFTLHAGTQPAVALQLSAATSLGFNTPPERGGRESFSLIFHAPAAWRGRQGIYTVTHPQLGEHAIFLVPIGVDARGMRLEAIFNFI